MLFFLLFLFYGQITKVSANHIQCIAGGQEPDAGPVAAQGQPPHQGLPRQAQAQSQAAQKAPWPTKVKVTLGIMFGVLVACLVVRLAVPSLQENQILNSATTLLLGLSCGALYLIRKDYPAPKPSKLDGVVNAVLIVFALVYGLLGVWGLLQLFA